MLSRLFFIQLKKSEKKNTKGKKRHKNTKRKFTKIILFLYDIHRAGAHKLTHTHIHNSFCIYSLLLFQDKTCKTYKNNYIVNIQLKNKTLHGSLFVTLTHSDNTHTHTASWNYLFCSKFSHSRILATVVLYKKICWRVVALK